MPKRGDRPWDRARGIGRGNNKSSSSPSPSPIVEYAPKPVSCVEVDGISFRSDRFYLHDVQGAVNDSQSASCTCGARQSPPLLNRQKLIESLDLTAAILATYTIDTSWVRNHEFPSLFDGSIPTLVLHGHKKRKQKQTKNKKSSPPQQTIASRQTISGGGMAADDSSSDEEADSEKYCIASSNLVVPISAMSEPGIKKEEEEQEVPPEEGWLRSMHSELLSAAEETSSCCNLGKSVHLTEIFPMWLPPQSSPNKQFELNNKVFDYSGGIVPDESKVGLQPSIVSRRQKKIGVHHSKYMILFEKSGSVIVMVSTSNLTRGESVDASWLQRFEPTNKLGFKDNARITKVSDQTRADGSDFGHVLANFLQCQSNAAKEEQMIPEDFMKRYLGISSLDNFIRNYKFEDSQVHLIATVPGNYRGRHTSTHLGKVATGKIKSFLYGPQRVADVLDRIGPTAKKVKSWLPTNILSDEDRLIFQQTSFGGYWKRESMAEIIRSYRGCDDRLQTSNAHKDDMILDRTDILWPTNDFMKRITKKRQKIRKASCATSSPESFSSAPGETQRNDKPSAKYDYAELTQSECFNGGFIFLSSKSFNTIDLHCISRMMMYESSYPRQTRLTLPPHIKTYGRMFEGNEYQIRQKYGFGHRKAEEIFSWIMLTSACLSRGAQGKPLPNRGFESDEMTYSNFELGILFCSRLQGQRKSDRLYCWKPNQCVCGREELTNEPSLIHLPLPYSLRNSPYQPDPEEADMCETPFFHEIPDGTGSIGQMRLCPLGKQFSNIREE